MAPPLPLRTSLDAPLLARYVARQLETMFPDGSPTDALEEVLPAALRRAQVSFAVRAPHTSPDAPRFDHLHTDQYATFLYFASSTAHRSGEARLAAKLYALNKALHAVDLYFEVDLPDALLLQHPVGTVLGRATYGEHLAVYQRCSVGSSVDGRAPVFGSGVVMYGGSAVIGGALIGDNCWLSAGCLVMDEEVPSGHIVFGRSPHLAMRPTARNVVRDVFGIS